MTPEAILGAASVAKGFTALTVLSLIADDALAFETRARELLGADLPLIDDAVTVEHLLGHTSGIGDYLDESEDADLADYALPVPAHQLDCAQAYLPILDGHPQVFAPGERFAYCNSGFVVLALLAERAAGRAFGALANERVCRPAGLRDTGFWRSDALPPRAALGYVEVEGQWRSNVFHLPVVGVGDGGVFTTVDDLRRLWEALASGAIAPRGLVAEALRARSAPEDGGLRYGLGFWVGAERDDVAVLLGMDAGVSAYCRHDRGSGRVMTILSAIADGAWPVRRALDDVLL